MNLLTSSRLRLRLKEKHNNN